MESSATPERSDSPRRALLEEILEARSRVVAALPVNDQDPRASSPLWTLGIMRVAGDTFSRTRRERALDVAVIALAWLEAVDRDEG